MDILLFLLSVAAISTSGALMPGPVLAVVIGAAPRNRWAGLEVVVGHAAVEGPLVLLIAFGLAHFLKGPTTYVVVGLAGGAMLIGMGIENLRAQPAIAIMPEGKRTRRSIAAGIIASLNPYFFLWWATAGAAIIARALEWSAGVLILAFLAHILVDLCWYGLVGYGAARSIRLGGAWQRWVLRLCGLIMTAFGGYFLWSAAMRLVP